MKRTLALRIDQLLDRRFRPGIPLRSEPAIRHGFNYVVDISTRMRGQYVYIVAKYRNPRPDRHEEFFEVTTTRVTVSDDGRCDLSYMRHTGKWQTVYTGLDLNECITKIDEEEIFWPL